MVNKVQKGGHWKYITDKYELFIPNEGYEFIFWDFGSSRSKNFPLRKYEIETLNTHFNNRILITKLQIALYFQWYRHKKWLRYC